MGWFGSRSHRRFCWVCWWGGRCWRYAAQGWFQRGSTWATILGVALLGIASKYGGFAVTFGNDWPDVVLSGVIYTAIAAATLFAFRLLIIAPFKLSGDGHWTGRRFTYHQKKLAFHRLISKADDNYAFSFYFPDAPPFAYIHYEIAVDGRPEHVLVSVATHWKGLSQMPDFGYSYGGGMFRVGRDRRLWLTTFLQDKADPRSVRIYVTGWETRD